MAKVTAIQKLKAHVDEHGHMNGGWPFAGGITMERWALIVEAIIETEKLLISKAKK